MVFLAALMTWCPQAGGHAIHERVTDLSSPGTPEGGEPLGRLGADEVRARGASGAALLGARGVLVLAFGVVANLVLARLLVPRDFGLVTLGMVTVVLGTFLGEAGVGAALIRRREPPSLAELRAINALQLAVAGALAVTCAGVAATFGRDGLVVAVMVASLPIWVLRGPSVIVLERQLQYRPIAMADVVEAISYYLWAIAAVALGLGVWGLATAVIVRALAGTATVVALGPVGVVPPRWSWPHVRPLVGFGAKFQGTAVLQVVREQAVNVGVAAVAGIGTLGVWNLAWRILQVPNLLFSTVGRVAYPVMSQLRGAGEDPQPVLERGVAALTALTGLVVVVVVGFAPALPVVVGDGWDDIPAVLLWSGIGLVVGAPVAAGTSGFLFATNQPGAVATATLLSTAAWLGVALPLLPALGAPAVGIGLAAATAVNGCYLGLRTAALTGAALASRVWAPTLSAAVATTAGWLVADASGGSVTAGLMGVAAGELILLAGLAAGSRGALRDARLLVEQGLRGLRPAGARPAAAAPAPPAPAEAPRA
jgi:O-antigen/teichoic acid export membrane protein